MITVERQYRDGKPVISLQICAIMLGLVVLPQHAAAGQFAHEASCV